MPRGSSACPFSITWWSPRMPTTRSLPLDGSDRCFDVCHSGEASSASAPTAPREVLWYRAPTFREGTGMSIFRLVMVGTGLTLLCSCGPTVVVDGFKLDQARYQEQRNSLLKRAAFDFKCP